MSFHGRRVPRPTLILSLARVMNSRFVGGDDEVGIVPYVVIVGVCECGREFVFGVWCEEDDFQKGLLVLNDQFYSTIIRRHFGDLFIILFVLLYGVM